MAGLVWLAILVVLAGGAAVTAVAGWWVLQVVLDVLFLAVLALGVWAIWVGVQSNRPGDQA